MDTTDLPTNPDEYLFEYDPNKGFNYEEFVKLSTPVMQEFIEPVNQLEIEWDDKPVAVDISDLNCDEAIQDMFDRLGIYDINQATNAVLVKKMTQITTEVEQSCRDHKGRYESHIGKMPINLIGTIYIYPKGLRIFT